MGSRPSVSFYSDRPPGGSYRTWVGRLDDLLAHFLPNSISSRQPIEDAEGSTYATPPPSTPTPTWRPDTFTGNLCPSQPEPSPLPLDTVTKLLLGTPSGHVSGTHFHHCKR